MGKRKRTKRSEARARDAASVSTPTDDGQTQIPITTPTYSNETPQINYERHHLSAEPPHDRINILNSCTNENTPKISKFSKEEAARLDHVTRWKSSGPGGFERVWKEGEKQHYTPEEGERVQEIRVAGKAAEYRSLDQSRKKLRGYNLESREKKRPATFLPNIGEFILKKSSMRSRTRENAHVLTPHKRKVGEDWKLGFQDKEEREMWRYSVVRDEDGVLLLIVYWQTEEERQDPRQDAGLIAHQVTGGTIDPDNSDDFIPPEEEDHKTTFRPLELLLNFLLGFNRASQPIWKETNALIEDLESGNDRTLARFISDLEKAILNHNYCLMFNQKKRPESNPKFSATSCPEGFEGLIALFDSATNWSLHGSRDMKNTYRAHHFKKDGGCQRDNPRRVPMYSHLIGDYWDPYMRMLARADQLNLSKMLESRMIQCIPTTYHNMSRLVNKSILRKLDHPWGVYPSWNIVHNYPNQREEIPAAVETSLHTDPLDIEPTKCGVLTFSTVWIDGIRREHNPTGCNLVLEDANVQVATRSGDSVYFCSSFLLHFNTPPAADDKIARHSLVTFFGQSLGSYFILNDSLNIAKEEEIAESIEQGRLLGRSRQRYLRRNPEQLQKALKYQRRIALNVAKAIVSKRVRAFKTHLSHLNSGNDTHQDASHMRWLEKEKGFKFNAR